MTRVGVLGANGQVGAELCLILKNHPGIEVIPICRNTFGSAFLRYNGIRCRHGRAADPAQAPSLIGDCDVVLNLALSIGGALPRVARRENRDLIRNSIEHSADGARIVYFSTRAVYGDPREEARIRWKTSYGQEKLRCEADMRRYSRKFGKESHILRLGHVCGDLQGLTALVRSHIAAGPVVLPGRKRLSDTVYTATIVDATLKIASGRGKPGTYDLMCHPQWTWTEVYEYEARRTQQPVRIERLPETKAERGGAAEGLAARAVRAIGRFGTVKEIGLRAAASLSPAFNRRLQALNGLNRARSEITSLTRRELTSAHLTQVAMGRTFMDYLEKTADIVDRAEYGIAPHDREQAWPQSDLEPATKRVS